MASEDDKRRFMEAACVLKNRENRVDTFRFMERMGWDNSEFRNIADVLWQDGDIRPNEYMTSSGAPTGEAAGPSAWNFFWVTQVGLRKWCSPGD